MKDNTFDPDESDSDLGEYVEVRYLVLLLVGLSRVDVTRGGGGGGLWPLPFQTNFNLTYFLVELSNEIWHVFSIFFNCLASRFMQKLSIYRRGHVI